MPKLLLLFALACGALLPAPADAQVRAGDARIHLDKTLFAWQRVRARGDLPVGRDYDVKQTTSSVGDAVQSGASVGIGYALSQRTVIDFALGLLYQSLEVEEDDDEVRDLSALGLELRPTLELLLGSGRFSPFAQVGLSYMRSRIELRGGDDQVNHAVGPVIGLGAHGFVLPSASVDVSFSFAPRFIFGDAIDAQEDVGVDDVKIRSYALFLNLGGSYWL